jgi:hypothetical protein
MASRTLLSIHDDQYGQGTELAFPTMSTCSAAIAVTAGGLVGVHKTMDRTPTAGVAASHDTLWTGTHKKIFDAAKQLIDDAGGAQELYVCGWNVEAKGGGRHEVGLIQSRLGCQAVPTFVYNYTSYITTNQYGNPQAVSKHAGKAAKDVCTFAFFRAGQPPIIGLKRTTKVQVPNPNQGSQGGEAKVETLVTPSDHLHELRKFRQFVRLGG